MYMNEYVPVLCTSKLFSMQEEAPKKRWKGWGQSRLQAHTYMHAPKTSTDQMYMTVYMCNKFTDIYECANHTCVGWDLHVCWVGFTHLV